MANHLLTGASLLILIGIEQLTRVSTDTSKILVARLRMPVFCACLHEDLVNRSMLVSASGSLVEGLIFNQTVLKFGEQDFSLLRISAQIAHWQLLLRIRKICGCIDPVQLELKLSLVHTRFKSWRASFLKRDWFLALVSIAVWLVNLITLGLPSRALIGCTFVVLDDDTAATLSLMHAFLTKLPLFSVFDLYFYYRFVWNKLMKHRSQRRWL